MMAFVLLLLATVLYDGASTAPEWTRLESALRRADRARTRSPPWRSRPPACWPSGCCSLGAYVGVSALMSFAVKRASRAARHGAQLRLHAGADRHRLSRRALPHLSCWCRASTSSRSPPTRSASAGTCSAPPATASTSPSSARASPGTTAVGAIVAGHVAAVYLAHRQGHADRLAIAATPLALAGSAHRADGGLHLRRASRSWPSRSSSAASRAEPSRRRDRDPGGRVAARTGTVRCSRSAPDRPRKRN